MLPNCYSHTLEESFQVVGQYCRPQQLSLAVVVLAALGVEVAGVEEHGSRPVAAALLHGACEQLETKPKAQQ